MDNTSRFRLRILCVLIFLVPLGFYTKHYHGFGKIWVSQSLGGVLYEIFWCLAAAAVFPKAHPVRISVIVFLATSVLECLQLWHPPFLTAIRATLIGRTLLGDTFTWLDFPYYVTGSVLGWMGVRMLKGGRV
ncbi:DUF2809 domain-containing protein [bacterium]|nr:DUF2809 domain-containing protein [bacterium]